MEVVEGEDQSKKFQDIDLESLQHFKEALICSFCTKFPKAESSIFTCPKCCCVVSIFYFWQHFLSFFINTKFLEGLCQLPQYQISLQKVQRGHEACGLSFGLQLDQSGQNV